ncbi:MAG TPA: alkaline phosphatase D family protein [Thermoanaerobaculia bacterium]|nr:alkaline phosphatase D family protein [Thermoanaerobaculia bacterium]
MLRLLLALLLLASPLAARQPASDAAALLRSGPMLGYSEITETLVWLQTVRAADAQIRFWKKGEPATARLSELVRTSDENDHIASFRLGGLAFGTEYEYEVYLDGIRIGPENPPALRTQPMWRWRTDPPSFRVAVGSCTYINDPPYDRPGTPYGGETAIFTSIARIRPDLMLWIGDNVYYREADWESESGMRYRYAYNRTMPEMAALLASTHNYATWDDHDYGPNNSDRTFSMKEVALEIFRDYWAPRTAGVPAAPGVFQKFTWGDVDFFLLDDRYHRTPNHAPSGPDKTMWGEEQLEWLLDSLTASAAPFKIVVNGNQVLNPLTDEGLPNFADYERLMRHIEEAKIGGVVFVTGDRHHAILMRKERAGTYPLFDLTTSPLTAGVSQAREGADHDLVVPGTYYPQRNFATLEFTGPRTDRSLTIRLHAVDGSVVWTRTIRAAELR